MYTENKKLKDMKKLLEKVMKIRESFENKSMNKHIDISAAYDMVSEDLQELYAKLVAYSKNLI